MEQTEYSVTEGETIDVCAVILGPDQISMGLEAFASLFAKPDTADGQLDLLQVPVNHMCRCFFLL